MVLAALAMVTEEVWLAGAAGIAALVAGLFTIGLADRLRRSHVRAEEASAKATASAEASDAMAARAARFEAEAIEARTHLSAMDAPSTAVNVDLARVTDLETGLYNQSFFAVTLDLRVSAARRGLRPLALALLEPVTGLGGDAAPVTTINRGIARSISETLRDSDIACRLDQNLIAVLLEDTPENGAVWTVERIRRRLASENPSLSLRAGVACYPAHAFDAVQLLAATRVALGSARDWRQDRIEVAAVPED